ncbi:Chromatin assembly factor 1 subunit B [Schistosoma japonicum]|nr:Chromatin assembly factor 1 subunit B [Schistosoma japonicum]
MRFLTPEIAWHETLPIYSCDLQNRSNLINDSNNSNNNVCNNFKSIRCPLSELNLKNVKDFDPDLNWTRLATAGGDNVVRLWRVQLNWLPGVSKTPTKTKQTEFQSTNGTVSKKDSGVLTTTGTTQKSDFKQLEHLTYLASLKRHEKPVNVVRWSPSGDYLASAGDDLFIILWSYQTGINGVITSVDNPSSLKDEDDDDNAAMNSEIWIPCRSLRRHLEDIYDVCWSPDERALISGSVDHSIIIWHLDLIPSSSVEDNGTVGEATTSENNNVSTRLENTSTPSSVTNQSGIKTLILRDHKHYVQGVTWDPLGFYVASLSSDRACRVYRAGTKNCLAHISKAGKQRLFQDDSWKSFFRRLTFSPDGLLLICPSGNLEEAAFAGSTTTTTMVSSTNISQPLDNIVLDTIPSVVAPQHAAHIFVRSNFTRPVVSLPTGSKPVVAVRFCPQPFQLRPVDLNTTQNPSNQFTSLFNLAYRWLFCLVLEDSVLFYDTQQSVPFAQVSQLHYQALNDASWSKDGHLVVVCSTDGYCSLIHFARGELGAFYSGTFGAPNPQPIAMETVANEIDKCQVNEIASFKTGDTDAVEMNNFSKVDVPSTSLSDIDKPPIIEPKISESGLTNNPNVVDTSTTVSKQKRRVQLTTLVSFGDGNLTNSSQISTNFTNDFDIHLENSTSHKFEERDIIEISDSSTS